MRNSQNPLVENVICFDYTLDGKKELLTSLQTLPIHPVIKKVMGYNINDIFKFNNIENYKKDYIEGNLVIASMINDELEMNIVLEISISNILILPSKEKRLKSCVYKIKEAFESNNGIIDYELQEELLSIRFDYDKLEYNDQTILTKIVGVKLSFHDDISIHNLTNQKLLSEIIAHFEKKAEAPVNVDELFIDTVYYRNQYPIGFYVKHKRATETFFSFTKQYMDLLLKIKPTNLDQSYILKAIDKLLDKVFVVGLSKMPKKDISFLDNLSQLLK